MLSSLHVAIADGNSLSPERLSYKSVHLEFLFIPYNSSMFESGEQKSSGLRIMDGSQYLVELNQKIN